MEYDLDDIVADWRFTSEDGRIELTLYPDFDGSTLQARDIRNERPPRT